LFIIYINDLPDVCKQFINVYLFADDAKLYKHVITDDDYQVLQKGSNTFQEWSDRWLLRLNINKCKIAFYRRYANYEYKYYLSSTDLERVDVIKGIRFRIKFCFSLQGENKQSILHAGFD